jgi:hypothetical protein
MGGDPHDLDLGDDHLLWFNCWKPDRELNPQYVDLPDVERVGAIVAHKTPAGEWCWAGIHFENEASRRVFPDHPRWVVESADPLTLSPSLLCKLCGDHGFIRAGRWVRA